MKRFICGFSGAGKSTLLRKLAGRSRSKVHQFIDLDDYILNEYGQGYSNLGDYIRSVGMNQFRKHELESITTLAKNEYITLSLGGGALREDTQKVLIENGFKGQWLATDFEVCYERISGDSDRPLSIMSKKELLKLYKEREAFYSAYEKINP